MANGELLGMALQLEEVLHHGDVLEAIKAEADVADQAAEGRPPRRSDAKRLSSSAAGGAAGSPTARNSVAAAGAGTPGTAPLRGSNAPGGGDSAAATMTSPGAPPGGAGRQVTFTLPEAGSEASPLGDGEGGGRRDDALNLLTAPLESLSLIRRYLLLWRQLDLFKHEWGKRKLCVEKIDTLPLYNEYLCAPTPFVIVSNFLYNLLVFLVSCILEFDILNVLITGSSTESSDYSRCCSRSRCATTSRST